MNGSRRVWTGVVAASLIAACTTSDPVLVGSDQDAGAGGTPNDAAAQDAADGGHAGDAGSPVFPTGAEQACADSAAVFCAWTKACWGSGYFKGYYGDDAWCLNVATRSCLAYYFAPGSTFAVTGLQACTAAKAAQTRCEVAPASCVPGPGTRENGEACGSATQCKSQFCCASYSACGTCCPAPQAGETCWQGACGEGLFCEPSSDICNLLAHEGDVCSTGSTATWCEPGLVCKGGHCEVLPGGLHEGEPCKTGDVCGIMGNCDLAAGVCVNHLHASATEGEPCDPNGSEICQRGLACQLDITTCVAGKGLGEACTDSPETYFMGNDCGNGLTCVDGRCVEVMWQMCP
jgi:hypothetical protein